MTNELAYNTTDLVPAVKFDVNEVTDLIPFHQAEARGVKSTEAIHFFLTDNRLRTLARRNFIHPVYYKAYAIIAPDFSVYYDRSETEWRNSIEANRRMAKWWAREGLRVVPSLTWADERSFDICFSGIEKGSVVAISVQGVYDFEIFWKGFYALLERLEPSGILCYGTRFRLIAPCPVKYFLTYSEKKWR